MFETYNDDCLKVLPKLIENGKKVEYVFTSPPYNRGRDDKYRNYRDTKSEEEYLNFLYMVTDYSLSLCGEDGFTFINVQSTMYNKSQIYEFMGHYKDKISNVIIWEKENPQPSCNYDKQRKVYSMTNSFEYIFALNIYGEPLKSNFCYTKNHITTNVTPNEFSKIHNATMNPKVSDWFVNSFTKEGDTVLDPFMGLGTTGISCLKFKRNFIGIELDKQYFDIATKRIKETEATSGNNLELLLC